MDASDEPPDDLRVRLTWPATAGGPDPDASAGPARDLSQPEYRTYESSEIADAEIDYSDGDGNDEPEVPDPRQPPTAQQLVLAGRSDSLQAALASIALRIDALTSTTSTFRNLVSDRLTDYSDQVGRLAAGSASDLDDYRHLHERALEQIRRSVGEAEDHLRKLTRTVSDLELKTVTLVSAVRDNADAVDHLLGERDQVSDGLLRSLERVGSHVQAGVEHGMEEVTASMARLEEALAELTHGRAADAVERLDEIVAVLADDREQQVAISSQLEASVIALGDDRLQGSDAIGRLEQAITAALTNSDRGLAKLASRIDARMDQLADGLRNVAGDDLPATLIRLDARLKELTTDLVSGRDRETAKALGQLSAQVDGVAAMVVEDRAQRQPTEARLNRLARASSPTVDLDEIHARLDTLAELMAAPVDLNDVHLHLDELAQMLSTRPAAASAAPPAVDPRLSAVAERLERLLPALESGADRRGRTPEATAMTGVVERLERLLPTLESATARRGRTPEPPTGGSQELLDRIDELGRQLGDQIEALRRRIALRARPATPELDESAIAAIAEAVIARLSATEPPDLPPPAPPPALPPGPVVSGEQRRRAPRGTR